MLRLSWNGLNLKRAYLMATGRSASMPSRLRQLLSGEGSIGPSIRLDAEPPPEIKSFIEKVIQSPLSDIAIPLSAFRWEYSKYKSIIIPKPLKGSLT
ncbi:hypothetical protein F2Q70_00001801 [Brassica cretica]|uniref:Uncharacterized protein n=1 Tax=Brassica cretica TaxID=69181 RepID=A0A8S9IRJ1_BRACR|nr:hypothetical protein F2Q70_00001801 [Brassica cretica]